MKDVFGKALRDYYEDNCSENIITFTNISEEDELSIPYLFRCFNEMPKIEQKAIELSFGKTLDVGCGSGSHSLELQERSISVKAIDISEGAIYVANQRGVIDCENTNLLNVKDKFDTILLLMNGTGIFQDLDHIEDYLKHLKNILNDKGQILIDSSDIKYMYEDEDGGFWIDTHTRYYGELDYHIKYKGEEEKPMKWLYLDFYNLQQACKEVQLNCEIICEGDHFDYLAKITHL